MSDINRPDYEKHVRDLGFAIPQVPAAMGLYVHAVGPGSLVFCSGQASVEGVLKFVGKVGDTLTQEDGYRPRAFARSIAWRRSAL